MAALILLIAAAMPAGLYLSGTPLGRACGNLDPANVLKIWGVVVGTALALFGMGAYYNSRRLILEESALRFRSWFHDRRWELSEIATLTYQVDAPIGDGLPESHIALWDAQERRIGRVSLRGWDIPRFREVFNALLAHRPVIAAAPEVRRLLSDSGESSFF